MKYRGNLAQGDALAVHLLDVVQRDGFKADLVAPVPLARLRQRERGYNQAALGVPYRPDVVARVRETPSQVGRSLASRRDNVADAFSARESRTSGRRVLLVDDVLTTGATLDAAAKALKQAGAVHVAAVVVSRAV